MTISPQRLTIYLYSAHRAVIFAIAQLSFFRNQFELMFYMLYSPQTRRDGFVASTSPVWMALLLRTTCRLNAARGFFHR